MPATVAVKPVSTKIKLIGMIVLVRFRQAVPIMPMASIGHKQRWIKSGDNLPSPIQPDDSKAPTPAAAVAVAKA